MDIGDSFAVLVLLAIVYGICYLDQHLCFGFDPTEVEIRFWIVNHVLGAVTDISVLWCFSATVAEFVVGFLIELIVALIAFGFEDTVLRVLAVYLLAPVAIIAFLLGCMVLYMWATGELSTSSEDSSATQAWLLRAASAAGLRGRSAIPNYWINAGKSLENALVVDADEFFDDMYPLPPAQRQALEDLMNRCAEQPEGAQKFKLVRALRVEDSRLWGLYQESAAGIAEAGIDGSFVGQGPPRTHELIQEVGPKGFDTLDASLCEAYLWHATKPEAAMKIAENGFRVDLAGSGTGTRFGKGCYFAEDPAKSDQYAESGSGLYQGCYAMILCRVLLGEQYHVEDSCMWNATSKAGTDHHSTVAEPPGDPREFVVYNAEQVYPEFAIVYERADASVESFDHQHRYWSEEESEAFNSTLPAYWANAADDGASARFDEMHPAIKMKPLIQALMNDTWVDKWTRDRKGKDGQRIPLHDPEGDMPVGVHVLKVLRVEDSEMWRTYAEKQQEIRELRDGQCKPIADAAKDVPVRTTEALPRKERGRLAHDINECYLFHGSSPTACIAIAEDNFDIGLSGSQTGQMFGHGAYFAECASKADEYSSDDADGYYKGYYAMLLCRVTMGEVQVLEDADVDAHSRCGPGGPCDSTIGDRESATGTYREFVVPSSAQIYPEYAIIYERVYKDATRTRGLRRTRGLTSRKPEEVSRLLSKDEEDEESSSDIESGC